MTALDRTPVDLLSLPAVDQLDHIAVWLDDCDTHLALRRPGGLPMPPFRIADAWVSVLLAKGLRQGLDRVTWPAEIPARPPQSMAVLATQEWFEPKEKAS